jgi:hypothetical protein
MLRRPLFRTVWAVLAASLVLGASANLALARTQPASFGTAGIGGRAAFNVATDGVVAIGQEKRSWIMPLVIDNPGAKSVRITARVHPGGSLMCEATGQTSEGILLGFSTRQFFPVTGAMATITVEVPAAIVPANGQAFMGCVFEGGIGTTLLGMEYAP